MKTKSLYRNYIYILVMFFSIHWVYSADPVTFLGKDNVELVGTWYPNKSLATKKTMVLLHGVASQKEEWNDFCNFLSRSGWNVLIYDQRGHGKSIHKKTGESIQYNSFYARGINSEWGNMVLDLHSAVQFISKSYKISQNSIVLGGASIGANIALRYASDHPEIPLAILLSPGLDYQGLTTHDAISKYGKRPLFIAVSPQDGYSYQSVMNLQSASQPLTGKGPLFTVYVESKNQGHGVQMFKRSSNAQASPLEQHIVEWLKSQQKFK